MDNTQETVVTKTETETSVAPPVETGPIAVPKPKRVLTEAQRLAFMKGREKRLANIERKRQEKLEAQQAEAEYEKPIIAEKAVFTEKPVEKPAPSIVIPDEFAEKVASIVADRIKIPDPPKVKRAYRRKVVHPDDPEKPVHVMPVTAVLPERHFSWL